LTALHRMTEHSPMGAAERVRVFWQPGCTSCLRTKEFLSGHGVDYESINVHGNPAGMAELRKLGARSVPIVARGDEFVFAQSLADVVRFLDLKVRLHEALSPEALIGKIDLVLSAAMRYVRQIPPDWLDKPFRNRARPIRILCHHVFRIPEAFVEAAVGQRELTYELIMQEPGPAIRTGDDLAEYGAGVLRRVKAWWAASEDRSGQAPFDTYFGRRSMQEVLERTAWHSAQHARQLMLILDTLGIEPDGRLTPADVAGLPLPEKAWDDE
jgi:glutaredoxin